MNITLTTGRICSVTWIQVSYWSANLLEGTREDASNRRRQIMPEILARYDSPDSGTYFIDPPQRVLPYYQCLAVVRSRSLQPENLSSHLTLAWFVDTLDQPLPLLIQQALEQINWEQLSRDSTFDDI